MARILIKAVQNGQEALAREIILRSGSGGGIDSQTSSRDGTALFFCSSRGYLELAKLLLERGANVGSTDKNRATPLHGAVDNGFLDVVRLLLSHGADVNAQTYRGDTPLHLSAYRGFGEITKCLMAAGADPLLLNCNSFTAENEARARGHHDLCNYMRDVQQEQHLAESSHRFDSMIKLDPPSLASSIGLQTDEKHESTQHRQKSAVSYPDNDVSVRRDQHRCVAPLRSKSCDCANVGYNDLPSPTMKPPVKNFSASSHRNKLIQRHSAGTGSPTMLLRPTDAALSSNSRTIKSSSPGHAHDNSSPVSSQNISWAYPGSRPVSGSPKLLHPSTPSHNVNNQRRPSTGSAGSCFSDFSVGTGSGSDAGSLPSIGSDMSGYFSDSRREDIELTEPQFGERYEDSQDKDLVLLSLGVKNPPGHKRQLSVTSEVADIYDSSLFSFNSLVSVCRSSSVNEYSQVGSDLVTSDLVTSGLGTNCSRLTCLELNPEPRSRLHRATSVTCPFPSPQTALRARPDYNKSLSTEYKPVADPPAHKSVFCPRFNRMISNDLSSTLPQTNQSSHSMTCVNIPLN